MTLASTFDINPDSFKSVTLLDCTFRDGGYYNAWDFPKDVVNSYLIAMKAAQVDIVELGFRFLANNGFKGPNAYTTDDYLRSLDIPDGLDVAVMINGSDMLTDLGLEATLRHFFPEPADQTTVDIVRFACHFHEFERVLPAVGWLVERGYRVGFNLMQIADRSREEIHTLARKAQEWPIEVLYFADSMGSMTPEDTAQIVGWLREIWDGPLGIHTHDNMGLALATTLRAVESGVTWLDSTVTGMGRGPGNARTEELVIEAAALRGRSANLVPLMTLIRKYFGPLKAECGWGSNPYYYLSGKYGIHPTYIQEMLGDARYDEEDILAVIEHLRIEGGKKFSFNTLDGARTFFRGEPRGTWAPGSLLKGREVLILAAGMGVSQHRDALESFIRRRKPVVMALNTASGIDSSLIDLRVACHPVRLLADAEAHARLAQPLITPASMLPESVRSELGDKTLLDFGLGVEEGTFAFGEHHCVAPSALVAAYAMAVARSGDASALLMAGFDGYAVGDVRNVEMEDILRSFAAAAPDLVPLAVTPTNYSELKSSSIYGL